MAPVECAHPLAQRHPEAVQSAQREAFNLLAFVPHDFFQHRRVPVNRLLGDVEAEVSERRPCIWIDWVRGVIDRGRVPGIIELLEP